MITPLGKTRFSHGSPGATRGTLRIAETFTSRQGEGLLTGTESFFVRTSGCNLRCWFCDTPYASWTPQGQPIALDDLTDQIMATELEHVVLTGGEPMLPRDIVPLCDQLRSQGLHVTIETAGTVDRPVECDVMSISPKFASSGPAPRSNPKWSALHDQRRMPIEIMRKLIARAPAHQIKFVVDTSQDYAELLQIVDRLDVSPDSVWVMPQGSTIEAMDRAVTWLMPWTLKQGFRYCDRMQIRWYGNRRGT